MFFSFIRLNISVDSYNTKKNNNEIIILWFFIICQHTSVSFPLAGAVLLENMWLGNESGKLIALYNTKKL